jgi:hypothetical protein
MVGWEVAQVGPAPITRTEKAMLVISKRWEAVVLLEHGGINKLVEFIEIAPHIDGVVDAGENGN